MPLDDASLKRTFERCLWQRSELLKLLEASDPAKWMSDDFTPDEQGRIMCYGSLYENAFQMALHEWKDLERIAGREPCVVNDDDLDGDPATDIPEHAITIVWLRSRAGCLSLLRQNEARKAAMLFDFDQLDLDQQFSWMMGGLPIPGMNEPKEIRATLRQIMWNWCETRTVSIGGLRHGLERLGLKADLARIYPPGSVDPA
ncbi:MAG: hypothetical protein KF754_07610 [Planctomycetes bacterium]|nr:hypothetical protein [Planctomycetota bacterium]